MDAGGYGPILPGNPSKAAGLASVDFIRAEGMSVDLIIHVAVVQSVSSSPPRAHYISSFTANGK